MYSYGLQEVSAVIFSDKKERISIAGIVLKAFAAWTCCFTEIAYNGARFSVFLFSDLLSNS